jgi:hypothetical protein
VQFLPLFHIPHSDLRSDNYLSSCYQKPANLAYNLHLFHSHSTNISQIANLIAGGERAHQLGQSAYSSCHDTIRTQILNCGQSGRNHTIGTAVRFQTGQKPAGICPVRVTTCQDLGGSVSWRFLTRTGASVPGPTRTEAG